MFWEILDACIMEVKDAGLCFVVTLGILEKVDQ